MEKTEGQQARSTKRKSPTRKKQDAEGTLSHGGDDRVMTALMKQVSRLEAENKALLEQIAAMANSEVGPVQPQRDCVREQRHSFFKYCNARRY
jgi:putative heme degradation protein